MHTLINLKVNIDIGYKLKTKNITIGAYRSYMAN